MPAPNKMVNCTSHAVLQFKATRDARQNRVYFIFLFPHRRNDIREEMWPHPLKNGRVVDLPSVHIDKTFHHHQISMEGAEDLDECCIKF